MTAKRNRALLRSDPIFKGGVYDTLKWIATIFLPAFGTLYFALAQIWGLPAAEEVVGTTVALDLFLGTLLGISKKQYENSGVKYDGSLVVDTKDPSKDVFSLEVDTPLLEIADKKDITLKVKSPWVRASQF